MLGFSALSETALSELPSAGYERPHATQVNFAFDGTAYTRPAADAADFSWSATVEGVSGDLAVVVDFDVAGAAAHGVAGSGAITVDFVVAGEAEFTNINIEGDLAVVVGFDVAGSAAHGVAGSGAVDIGFSVSADAAHGVAGSGAVTLTLEVSGAAAHGVAGSGAIIVSFDPAGDAVHLRYEVRGQVKQSGVLVNRRVRAYRRDTGEMVGEADTTAGKFQVHTGFEALEHYIVPVNLAEDATDWSPPVANRVLSVLAQDA